MKKYIQSNKKGLILVIIGLITLFLMISNTKTFEVKEEINIIDSTMLKDEISKLSYEDKLLLKERYFNDRTQSEVANILGLSQVKVSRCEKKILEKLRSNMTI